MFLFFVLPILVKKHQTGHVFGSLVGQRTVLYNEKIRNSNAILSNSIKWKISFFFLQKQRRVNTQ